MAGHETTKSLLDSELLFLRKSQVAPPGPETRVPITARSTAWVTQPTVAETKPLEQVTVKLVAKRQKHASLQQWVARQGGEVLSRQHDGDVVLVNLPTRALGQLETAELIQRAEAPRAMLPRLDEARGAPTRLAEAISDFPASGDGVVVGVIDSGVDWSHPDFQTDAGLTRIECFIHAHLPQDSGVSTFDVYTESQISAALDDQLELPLGDPVGHGTHCASIAVGNGRGSHERFRGVAPGAALMAMRSEPLLDTHTVFGIREFFQRAGDRPAVISLSLGTHIGAHDGTSALENVIAQESGPGRIIVVAAGNEGGDGVHWTGQLQSQQTTTLEIRVADPTLQVIDLWVPRGDEVSILIETPDGITFDPDGTVKNTVFGHFVADWMEDPINRDQNLTIRIAGGNVNFRWKIHLRAGNVLNGEVHAWGQTDSASNASMLFPGFQTPDYSVGIPGTEERAIVVGSFLSKNHFETPDGILEANALTVGQLSPFSSRGPTRTGKQKPDIAAPGQYITAALASRSHYASSPSYRPRHHTQPGYITIQGTSMATPFVAGVIALMLEREPRLTPEEIQQRLRITARRDPDTGRVWDPGFGYGKIDVHALLGYEG